MPPVTYSTLQPLLDHITANMTPNANNENTGIRTQLLLQSVVLSLIAIIGEAPAPTGSIQPWDAGLEYDDQVIVSHGGRLWLYIKSGPNTGTEPGTDEEVWIPLAMVGGDGGGGTASSWLEPVYFNSVVPHPAPPEGYRTTIQTGASGVFAGHVDEIATYSGGEWLFYSPSKGDIFSNGVGLFQYDPDAMPRWNWVYSLDRLLAGGNKTIWADIEISEPTAVAFRNNSFLTRLIGNNIAADHEVIMPAGSGTLALTTDIPPSSSEDLQAVLVNGNETLGRSVQISENDGVNWLQGANYVRVKAPALLTAPRNVTWPDKDGVVAMTTDITAAIDALLAGAPGALDTLNELAAALGDDANFAATTTAALALKAPLASPAMTGTPTVPTAAPGTDTTQVASTAFVKAAVDALPAGEPPVAAGTTAQYYRGDKTWQSLGTAVAATSAVTANTAKVSNATHTGDVTGSTALTIGANKVTNAKAAQMPANTIKGNNTGATANQADLTVAQTKTMLALDAVDNTSDADKPVSTAQQAALDLKAPLASPALTGTPTAPTAAPGTNSTQIATTAYAKDAVDTAIATEVTNRNAAITTAVSGRDSLRGNYDASSDLFPTTGGSGVGGAVMKADYWIISVTGTLDGNDVPVGSIIKALSDGPGQTGSLWYIDSERATATTAEAEDRATTDDESVLTPMKGWDLADKALSLSPLTGLSLASVDAIVAADTSLAAHGKAQAQLDAIKGTNWIRLTLNQTGTGAPTITGRAGSYSGAITPARSASGEYTLTVGATTFTANKTHVYADFGLNAPLGTIRAGRATGTVIGIKTWNSSGTAADDMLVDTSIYIVVEP